jgi:hypothetical protein
VNYSSAALPGAAGGKGLPGAQTNACKVPNLKGNTRSHAIDRLRHAHCKVGSTHRRFSGAVKAGHVMKTSPGSGQGTNSRVSLYVSKGPRHRHHKAHRSAAGAAVQLNRLAARLDLTR